MYQIDSDRQKMTFMGISIFEQGKGEYMTLAPRNKPWNEEEGLHGAIVRIKVPASAYDLKLSLLKGSYVNDLISTAVKLDVGLGTGYGPMIIKDLDGSSLVSAEISYFYPLEMKNSTDPVMNEWEGFAAIPKTGWHEGAARLMVPTV